MEDRRDHWENVYATKTPHEVSWTQELPETSLALIRGFNLAKDAPIIDIGGGDSKLADYLYRKVIRISQCWILRPPRWEKINCLTEDHLTPFNTKQHFLFCSFKANARIC